MSTAHRQNLRNVVFGVIVKCLIVIRDIIRHHFGNDLFMKEKNNIVQSGALQLWTVKILILSKQDQ